MPDIVINGYTIPALGLEQIVISPEGRLKASYHNGKTKIFVFFGLHLDKAGLEKARENIQKQWLRIWA